MRHTETMYNPEVSSQDMIQTEDLFNVHEQSIIHATTLGLNLKTEVRIKSTQTRQTKHYEILTFQTNSKSGYENHDVCCVGTRVHIFHRESTNYVCKSEIQDKQMHQCKTGRHYKV